MVKHNGRDTSRNAQSPTRISRPRFDDTVYSRPLASSEPCKYNPRNRRGGSGLDQRAGFRKLSKSIETWLTEWSGLLNFWPGGYSVTPAFHKHKHNLLFPELAWALRGSVPASGACSCLCCNYRRQYQNDCYGFFQ